MLGVSVAISKDFFTILKIYFTLIAFYYTERETIINTMLR